MIHIASHCRIAVRWFLRHKVYSAITIVGLSVGMACTILILLWIQDELSFDTFHRNAESTYLVLRGDESGFLGVSSRRLAPALMEEFPEVLRATSYMQFPENYTLVVQRGDRAYEEHITLADSLFFRMFSFPFLEGEPSSALSAPGSVVITEDLERKFFGGEQALGKPLSLSAFGLHFTMNVSGVVKTMPENSSFQRQLYLPISWRFSIGMKEYGWQDQSVQTYVRLARPLRDAAEIRDLSERIRACELRHDPNEPSTLAYSLLPLTQMHLHGSRIGFLQTTGDIRYVQIFFAVALIILVIAGVNHVNLSTALSLKRGAEVGMRKAVGATRPGLVMQFLGESIILTVIALSLAFLLAELFLPWFNGVSGKHLVIRCSDPWFLGTGFGVALLAGVLSGSYPAFFLSLFSPVTMLRGKTLLGPRSLLVRKGLLVAQFALSIIIVVCTVVVFSQLSFIMKSDLGFDRENILCLQNVGEANSRYEILKNQLMKNPDILSVCRSEPVSAGSLGKTLGVGWPGKPGNEERPFWVLHAAPDMASTYRFAMREGRFFSDQYPSDASNAYVINEAAAKLMGPGSPLHKELTLWGRKGQIIGITRDFHFASFHSVIEPLVFAIPPTNEEHARFSVVSLRVKAGAAEHVLAYVAQVWAEQMPGIPLNAYFFDDAVNTQYRAEKRMSEIFQSLSLVSLLIACLGLLGLSSISAQQRTKEFGIRKVLGASFTGIEFILLKEYLLWVVVSNVIAIPVAWYAMHSWLEGFAYRRAMDWWMFALAGGGALVVALLTVSVQSLRAATANPVESLRYE